MAAMHAPGGDEVACSDEEAEVDILSPQRTLSDGGESKETRPLPIPIPYQPEQRLLGTTATDSLEVNKLISSQDFEQFLDSHGVTYSSGLTASLKYAPGVCDELVAKVIAYRMFQLKKKLLLWFHMSLEESCAVVPETDVEVVVVRGHKDLAELQPSGRAHCYALVQEWERTIDGKWTVISLEAGFPAAFARLRHFIGATEKRVKAASELLPDLTQVTGLLSPEQQALYQALTPKDLQSYVRNPKNLPHLQPLLNPIAAQSPVFQLALTRLRSTAELWKSQRTTTFGSLAEVPATTLEWELRTGASPKEAHLRELGHLLPIHNAVACLRFPNASPKACKRLERIIYLLLTFLHKDRSEDYTMAYRLLHVRYLMDGPDALVLVSANWEAVLRLVRITKGNCIRVYYMLSALDSVWLLPKDQSLHRISLQVQEPLKDLLKHNSNTKALTLTSTLSANTIWSDFNSSFRSLAGYLTSSSSEQEATQEAANGVVQRWFGWLNRCGEVGSRSAKAMALHVFEQLEEVVVGEQVELEAYGPGFYGQGKAVVKEIQSLIQALKFPKTLK